MGAFYRVQVLWSDSMTQSAAEYLETPEGRGMRTVEFVRTERYTDLEELKEEMK